MLMNFSDRFFEDDIEHAFGQKIKLSEAVSSFRKHIKKVRKDPDSVGPRHLQKNELALKFVEHISQLTSGPVVIAEILVLMERDDISEVLVSLNKQGDKHWEITSPNVTTYVHWSISRFAADSYVASKPFYDLFSAAERRELAKRAGFEEDIKNFCDNLGLLIRDEIIQKRFSSSKLTKSIDRLVKERIVDDLRRNIKKAMVEEARIIIKNGLDIAILDTIRSLSPSSCD